MLKKTEAMEKDLLSELMGYTPGREMRAMILKEVRDTGKDIREVASKYTLPEMAILDAEGKFEYQGKRITPDEFFRENPLGDYGKIVTVKSRQ